MNPEPVPARTVLFSYAHPDDESFVGSGLAMGCVSQGGRAVLVTATLGQRGRLGDPPVCRPDEVEACREAELRAACGIIGIEDLHLLGFTDGELREASADAVRHALVTLIRRYQPDLVVSFDPNGLNLHPDHIAIARFTIDAAVAAADPRWYSGEGAPHRVPRLLWTPPLPPWQVTRVPLDEQPGVDFVLDVSAWSDRRAAALRAHRSQHLSIDRCFFSQPDVAEILKLEIYRQGWGPPLTRR
ncbi:MAG: PIG-L family deacetylase, partial [Vicinamibacterales bacterium]